MIGTLPQVERASHSASIGKVAAIDEPIGAIDLERRQATCVRRRVCGWARSLRTVTVLTSASAPPPAGRRWYLS